MGLKSILFGTNCNICKDYGVTCTQGGVLASDDQDHPVSKSVIHVDGRDFVCQEPINQCPTVLKEIDRKQVTDDIRSTVGSVRNLIVQPEFKRRSSKNIIYIKDY